MKISKKSTFKFFRSEGGVSSKLTFFQIQSCQHYPREVGGGELENDEFFCDIFLWHPLVMPRKDLVLVRLG